MKRNIITILTSLLVISIPSAASAQNQAMSDRPEVFRKLVECRTISDNVERLACYDRQTAVLDQAERSNELMVVDRQQVQKAKKGLFGLSIPSLGNLLGKNEAGKQAEEEVEGIETIIRSARVNGAQKWVIILEDGARWVQTDTRSIFDPKPGQPIRIRKASMGSFLANVNKQTAIRVRREN